MRHPERGVIGPDSFIPAAEAGGWIEALTDRVVEESVKRAAAWHGKDGPIAVSINLSAAALKDLSYPDSLFQHCLDGAVPPEQIVLELTESSLAGDPDVLLEIMARLRLKKFKLSIDDFGTGFSSLEQLKGLPFHELKIDKSFVLDALDNTRSRSILENSLRLATDLNLKTVAEGVETREHLQLLRELGCDIAQGYLIARPMPADDVPLWLDQFDANTL